MPRELAPARGTAAASAIRAAQDSVHDCALAHPARGPAAASSLIVVKGGKPGGGDEFGGVVGHVEFGLASQ